MKKGFTLAELMGVVVILALLTLIIVPSVTKSLKDGKNNLLKKEEESIKASASLLLSKYDLNNGEEIKLTLYQLKYLGYVDIDIKNPKTSEFLPNDALVTVKKEDNELSYTVSFEGDNTRKYENIPKIVIDDVITYVELGSTYVLDNLEVSFNDKTLNTDIVENVDTTKVGSYNVSYKVEADGYKNLVYKNILVRDTTGPSITFDTLYIDSSELDTYDYLSDVVVSDNSEVLDVKVETNFGALKGEYVIKYIAKDIYNNQTIKYRKVIVN